MTLRILSLSDVMPTADSGAAGTDYLGAEALRQAGNEVDTVWADELPHRIRHYNLRYLFELPAAYRRIVVKRFGSRKYDVVQISQPHGYLAAKWVRERAPGTIFIHRSHGLEGRARDSLRPWRDTSKITRPVVRGLAQDIVADLLERSNRNIARYAHGHMVSASECASYLTRVYGVTGPAVRAIPQAVPDAYIGQVKEIDAVRLRRILYVGQYAFFKAPHLLGKVISGVLGRRPDATFTWVCATEHHDLALHHIDVAVRDRVRMLGGMTQDGLRSVYDEHGVFVFPSLFEGFGKAFLEAMARGLVVVVADNGGMRDVVEHGMTGYKCQTGDAEAMSATVLRVLSDIDAAREIASRAAVTAATYTWARFGTEATRFYEDLIGTDECAAARQQALRHA